MTQSATAASGDPSTLTSATTRAPAAFADCAWRIRSGLLPDCEMAMNSAPSRFCWDSYTELTDGDADAVNKPTCVSKTYFAKVAAWSELPRAHVTMKRGGR